ncbi:MAG TPA: hypothetical protein VHC22_28160 [Pirellulales bacterium]|nr:hypothetical protein [Pirellulales bacterium]
MSDLDRRYWPLLLLLALGCSRGPAAPILSDSHVYQSANEGLRFLVPDGWHQSASSVLPPGELRGDVLLVRYNLTSDAPGSALLVLCTDEKKAGDPEAHHAEASFRADHWEPLEPAKTVTVHGVPAERIIYEAVMDGKELRKFVTCFRRKGRLYSFVGLFAADDASARQQIERASDDVIWTP